MFASPPLCVRHRRNHCTTAVTFSFFFALSGQQGKTSHMLFHPQNILKDVMYFVYQSVAPTQAWVLRNMCVSRLASCRVENKALDTCVAGPTQRNATRRDESSGAINIYLPSASPRERPFSPGPSEYFLLRRRPLESIFWPCGTC